VYTVDVGGRRGVCLTVVTGDHADSTLSTIFSSEDESESTSLQV